MKNICGLLGLEKETWDALDNRDKLIMIWHSTHTDYQEKEFTVLSEHRRYIFTENGELEKILDYDTKTSATANIGD